MKEPVMVLLLEPFAYDYMTQAMWVSALVGGLCGFLSAYLVLRGWSLIGDALAHSVVPGVAVAYLLGLPFAAGALVAGALAASTMLFLSTRAGLKADVIIGVVFITFFGLGLFIISVTPVAISVQTITMGNILAITPQDALQLVAIAVVALALLMAKWQDLMVVFFDENHAQALGLRPGRLKAMFFALLAVSVVAAMQTVGAFLVVAMVITPGASACLLCDRFGRLIVISVLIGAGSGFAGAYASYFLNGATGGVIVSLQSLIFVAAFVFAPRHGVLAARRRARHAPAQQQQEGAQPTAPDKF